MSRENVDEVEGLRAMLRIYRCQIADLDVVERAEGIVRDFRQQQLTQALEDTLAQLDTASGAAREARECFDVLVLIEAERKLGAMQHMAQTLLRRHMTEMRAAEQARTAYKNSRQELSQRVKTVENMLAHHRMSAQKKP